MKTITGKAAGGKKLFNKVAGGFRRINSLQQKARGLDNKNKQEIELEAITCSITGALNRSGLCKLFDNIVPSTLNVMCVVFIKINNIENIIERLGKESSNELLKQFVAQVNESCGHRDIIARWNATEFFLVCPESSIQQTINIAKAIEVNIKKNNWSKGLKLSCRAVVDQINGSSIQDIISRAKSLIIKSRGKSEYNYFVEPSVDVTPYVEEREIDRTTLLCPLTGILNRVGLSHYFNDINGPDLRKTSVVFIEIASFKTLFQQYGKETTKDIIVKFVAEIHHNCRPSDTLARWSAKEYLLICPNTSNYQAQNIAKEIELAIQSKTWLKSIEISCNTEAWDANCGEFPKQCNTVSIESKRKKINAA